MNEKLDNVVNYRINHRSAIPVYYIKKRQNLLVLSFFMKASV